jgi:amidase
MDDLCFAPAVELARRLRAREISARELLGAYLERIGRVNPAINAIVTLAEDRAARQAAAADEAAARGEFTGPLHGLPIAIKDLVETAGIRTTYGSPVFADHVPETDAPMVTALKRAGAIIIGKTNTPEFGMGSQTFNQVFGVTRNPFDIARTPGGSSGGAAAAVAAGLLPFADGSDLAASVRNPAAMCGLYGLRTTPGTVAADPAAGDVFDPLSVAGPIARSAADAALLLAGLRGHDRALPLAGAAGAGADGPGVTVGGVAGLRIAWSPDLGGLAVEPEVARVLEAAKEALAEAGAVITDVPAAGPGSLEWLADADEVFQVLRGLRMAGSYGPMLAAHRDQMKDTLIWNTEYGLSLTPAQIAGALSRRNAIFGRMREFLRSGAPAAASAAGGPGPGPAGGAAGGSRAVQGGGFDVLACPTVQVLPFSVDTEWVAEIDGVRQETYIDWLRTCSRITVTAHPAVSVPAGLSPGGLPAGVQLTGPYGSDERLLAIAGAVGQVTMPEPARPRL